MTRFFSLLVAFALITSFGCGSDDDASTEPDFCTDAEFTTATSTAGTEYATALQVYTADPSRDNCVAYQTAGNTYITALQRFENCENLTVSSTLPTLITNTQASIDALSCQ
jgi:hypothetical protein